MTTTTETIARTGAWHGDPALKAEVVARLRAHRAEDSLVKGVYQELDPDLAFGYRGCAIGCTLPPMPPIDRAAPGRLGDLGDLGDLWHARVEEIYGIPRALARLVDDLFETLPTEGGVHAAFAVHVVDAVPVGADLSLVVARFALDVLTDQERGTLSFGINPGTRRSAIYYVLLCRRALAGDPDPLDDLNLDISKIADTNAFYNPDSRQWQADLLIRHLAAAPVPGPAPRGEA